LSALMSRTNPRWIAGNCVALLSLLITPLKDAACDVYS